MKLELVRTMCGAVCTIGDLLVDGARFCYTLEDVVRGAGEKVAGKTAIPAGVYAVRLTHSPRFGRVLPLIDGVPGFAGVRIHRGNTAADTEGCVLVGLGRAKDKITNSAAAFDALFAKLQAADRAGEKITLEVRNVG
ncbi:MAG: DUF5675 family protein [Plesiomonas shigelloides]